MGAGERHFAHRKTSTRRSSTSSPGSLLLLILGLHLAMAAHCVRADLCDRCESDEIRALHRYYLSLNVSTVTFRQFVANLLFNLRQMPSLASLYRELSELVVRYDDCVLTCSIPFTRRRRRRPRLGGHSPGGDTERWRSLAAGRMSSRPTDGRTIGINVGLCEALAVTLFGAKLRCRHQKLTPLELESCWTEAVQNDISEMSTSDFQ